MTGIEMTKEALRESCEKNKLYRTARLNDRLYLHYKGWDKVQNLEEYIGLKVLWLEGNGLLRIEGLQAQTELRTLYLQENVIEKIENLEQQARLDTLNLAQNFIATVENLGHMAELKTLLLPQNKLKHLEGLEHVALLPELSCLDIQKNNIADPAVLDVLERCPKLAVLYLQGNPCVKKIRFYRKTVIARLKQLKYLDDRPVFGEERLRAEAWCQGMDAGGVEAAREAEKLEMERQRAEKRKKEEANFLAFENMMLQGKKIREEREEREQQGQQGQGQGQVAAAAAAAAPELDAAVPPLAPAGGSDTGGATAATVASDSEPNPALSSPNTEDDEQEVSPHSGEAVLSKPEDPACKAFREDKLRRAEARQAGREEDAQAQAQDAAPPAPPPAALVPAAPGPVPATTTDLASLD